MKAIPYKLQDGSILGQGIVYSLGGINTFCPPWAIFGLGAISTFLLKKSDKKIVKIHKDFEL